METPDLSRVIETSVPIPSLEFGACLGQLRLDVLPHIRKLQAGGQLRWFSFLIHPASQLLDGDPDDRTPVIHIRLEPTDDLDTDQFIALLPSHFDRPVLRALSEIDGLDPSILCDGDWAHGWRLVGESSDWVLTLLENHQATPTPQQVVQFLHYITNPVALGGSCLCIPGGFLPF
jgi:hypothetical protein